MNAFKCSSCLRVCVELAGVRPENVQVEVSAERLVIRGYRATPEPIISDEPIEATRRKPVRVLTMEIHHGEFEREIELPEDLDPERFTTQWDNGLLWILIPRKAHA
ncbi:MAG: Hsp20/alpha crystallin family protein [Verrucomicrobia bacterium]|nr:Hsp20/alpha crystallin family protein [Verrucomicrobiota bacterium]